MTVNDSNAFKTWLDYYAEEGGTDSAMQTTNAEFMVTMKDFSGDTGGDVVINNHILFPDTGFAMAYMHDAKQVAVCVFHHGFKNGPSGLGFDGGMHRFYALSGLGVGVKTVQVRASHFGIDPEKQERVLTPTLESFMSFLEIESSVTAHLIKVALEISKEMLEREPTGNERPFPHFYPRKAISFLPFLMTAFQNRNPKVILEVMIRLIKDYALENLSEKGAENLWIACYSTLQGMWYLGQVTTMPHPMTHEGPVATKVQKGHAMQKLGAAFEAGCLTIATV